MDNIAFSTKCFSRNRQTGQAIVLVLLLTMVGVLGAIALVSTGILTSEKMQLQNAADATAYSVSVIEARDLNFTAYMNRAMVANEVAIGQMVGMQSWAYMTRSTPEFIDDYAYRLDVIIAAATLGTATGSASASVRPVTQGLRNVSNPVFRFVEKFTTAAPYFSLLNKLYSGVQEALHWGSLSFSSSALFEIKDENIDDAEFSSLGILSLLVHFASYYDQFPRIDGFGFINPYTAGGNADDRAGMRRLAEVINNSRDGFTHNRNCDVQLGGGTLDPLNLGILNITFSPPGVNCRPNAISSKEGGWDATLLGVDVTIDVFLLIADFSIALGIGRDGGTDLRESSNGEYTWTGADTTDPIADLGGGFQICAGVPFIGRVCAPRVGFVWDAPTPPFGVGAALAGDDAPNMNDIPHSGDAREIMYGGASANELAWEFVLPPFVPTPDAIRYIRSVKNQVNRPDRNIHDSYALRGYIDTEDVLEIFESTDDVILMSGMEAPYLLIGLIKDNVVNDSHQSAGRFELDTPQNDLLDEDVPFGVIAKSEVYYARPDDLSYFARPDSRIENASGFNPYWQARLVDTSYFDRVAALGFQHQQIPLPADAFTIIEQAGDFVDALR